MKEERRARRHDLSMIEVPFKDRRSAGELLAREVSRLNLERPIVYALPRGGVPVGAPIARALAAPLDILLVRKIGVPGHEELAAASVVDGEAPDIVLNEDVIRHSGLTRARIDALAAQQLKEIERRRALYLPERAPQSSKGRTAIVVDDGIATGASMRAAIAALKRRDPLRVVVAVPVAAADTVRELRREVDDVICLAAPESFGAVGYFYRDFHQLDDSEVVEELAALAQIDHGVG
jgi:putative phosphoribosyl transferase